MIHGPSVSLDQAAEQLGVSRRTIYNRIRTGHLQTFRTMNGSQRVLVTSVQDEQHRDPAPATSRHGRRPPEGGGACDVPGS